jgi:putative endonuclease
MVDLRQHRGKLGEAQAARYLQERGWSVLARNWRAGHKELDLVARRGSTVAFVEVKARRSGECGHPLESITRRKRRDVSAAALEWLRTDGRALEAGVRVRFDAVAVHLRPGRPPVVEHLPDAWRLGSG